MYAFGSLTADEYPWQRFFLDLHSRTVTAAQKHRHGGHALRGTYRMHQPPCSVLGHLSVSCAKQRLGVIVYRFLEGDICQLTVLLQRTLQTEKSADGLMNELIVLNGHFGQRPFLDRIIPGHSAEHGE